MLRVRLFGGLSVLHGDGVPVGSIQPRRLAVLARIARTGRRGVMRDRLLAQLWPDADEETGRKALSQALYTLRRDLREEALFEGVQELRLNAEVASCDVVEFDAAYAQGDLERAAQLYEGPFLDGFRVSGAPEFERAERAWQTCRALLVLVSAGPRSVRRDQRREVYPARSPILRRQSLRPVNDRTSMT